MSGKRRPIKPPSGKVRERAVEACRRNSIPYPIFHSWLRDLEFDLQKNPSEVLRYIAGGDDSFHEAKRIVSHQGKQFTVTWELDWERGAVECFHLLDVTIVEAKPKMAKSSP